MWSRRDRVIPSVAFLRGVREGAQRHRRRPLANRSTGGGTQFRSGEPIERSMQLHAAIPQTAAQKRDFGSFHSREHRRRVSAGGADLKRIAGRDERQDRDRVRSARGRGRSAVPKAPRATPSSRSRRSHVCGDEAVRRLTDWKMGLHALRRPQTEASAERHDVASDG